MRCHRALTDAAIPEQAAGYPEDEAASPEQLEFRVSKGQTFFNDAFTGVGLVYDSIT